MTHALLDSTYGPVTRLLRKVISLPRPAQVDRVLIPQVDPPGLHPVDFDRLAPSQVSRIPRVPPDSPAVKHVQGLVLPIPQVFGVVYLQRDNRPNKEMSNRQRRGSTAERDAARGKIEEQLRSLFGLLLPPASPGSRTFGGLDLPHPLYEFQAEGVKFLMQTIPGALLADDMGLGKTVQAIVALRMLARLGEVQRALVVAPKAVLTSWQRHLQDWAPEMQVATLQGGPWERWEAWRELQRGAVQIGIISYETLRNDVNNKSEVNPSIPQMDLVVADEIQRIKNPNIQVSKAIRSIGSARRWGLTGTPLENDASEPAAILNYLDQTVPLQVHEASDVVRHLDTRMLRRRKEQVLDELPALFSHPEHLELTESQRKAYDRAEREGIVELAGQPKNITNVLTLITRLKQICNDVNGHSAKLEWLCDYVEEAVEAGDKVLVFSQYLDSLDQIERKLISYGPLKYYGGLTDRRREEALQALESPMHHVMALQTRAGSVGLNLQAANHVVHFDSWWNPAVQSQATARTHRLGQRKTVFERTLVSVGTIEERIQVMLAEKRALFREVVDDLSVEGLKGKVGVEEMYALFDLDSRSNTDRLIGRAEVAEW